MCYTATVSRLAFHRLPDDRCRLVKSNVALPRVRTFRLGQQWVARHRCRSLLSTPRSTSAAHAHVCFVFTLRGTLHFQTDEASTLYRTNAISIELSHGSCQIRYKLLHDSSHDSGAYPRTLQRRCNWVVVESRKCRCCGQRVVETSETQFSGCLLSLSECTLASCVCASSHTLFRSELFTLANACRSARRAFVLEQVAVSLDRCFSFVTIVYMSGLPRLQRGI